MSTAAKIPHDPAEPAGQGNQQRERLLQSQRDAHAQDPRSFKEDALDDKIVSVEPDGTGPTSTETFDAPADRALGSGSKPPPAP